MLTIRRPNTYSFTSELDVLNNHMCFTYYLVSCEVNVAWKNQEVTVEEKERAGVSQAN